MNYCGFTMPSHHKKYKLPCRDKRCFNDSSVLTAATTEERIECRKQEVPLVIIETTDKNNSDTDCNEEDKILVDTTDPNNIDSKHWKTNTTSDYGSSSSEAGILEGLRNDKNNSDTDCNEEYKILVDTTSDYGSSSSEAGILQLLQNDVKNLLKDIEEYMEKLDIPSYEFGFFTLPMALKAIALHQGERSKWIKYMFPYANHRFAVGPTDNNSTECTGAINPPTVIEIQPHPSMNLQKGMLIITLIGSMGYYTLYDYLI